MAGTIERKLTVGFLSATILILAMGYGFYREIDGYLTSDRWVEHTHAVIDDLKLISLTVRELESCQRGFSMSGYKAYLVPCQRDFQALPVQLDHLGTLVRDNPAQVDRLHALRQAVQAKIDVVNERIDERTRLGAGALTPQFINQKGLFAMEALGKVLQAMSDEEERLLHERADRRTTHFRAALTVFAALTGLLAFLLAAVHVLIFRELRVRRRIETELGPRARRCARFRQDQERVPGQHEP